MSINRGIFLVPWSGLDAHVMVEQLKAADADFVSLAVKDSMGRSWTKSDVVPRWALTKDVLEEACKTVHDAGLKIRASVAMFSDTYQGQLHPEWVAVGSDGAPAQRPGWSEDWYYHLCPTRSEQREILLRFIEELVSRYPIDGIDLDFIRFPWKSANEDGPEREFCFCSVCRRAFETDTGFGAYQLSDATSRHEWYGWRGRIVTSMVEEVSRITQSRNLGLAPFIALWTSDGFGPMELTTAFQRYGQDHAALARLCTELSPMLYHKFTDERTCYTLRTVRWVRDMTWHLRELGANVCAVVQGGPPATPLEVVDAVRSGVDAGATAVMSYPGWSWTVDNEYWVRLSQAYRELGGLGSQTQDNTRSLV